MRALLQDVLPTLNATLNAVSFTLLVAGLLAIKRGDRDRHMRRMVGAFVTSCAFLISYVTHWVLFGETRFGHEGTAVRAVFLTILVTHVTLAVAVVPMAIRTLHLAWRGDFARHPRAARITLPVWLYVSVTGVIIYVMLHHIPGRQSL
jgi:uncharacterized membrane protein YozB (DUF420 family)